MDTPLSGSNSLNTNRGSRQTQTAPVKTAAAAGTSSQQKQPPSVLKKPVDERAGVNGVSTLASNVRLDYSQMPWEGGAGGVDTSPEALRHAYMLDKGAQVKLAEDGCAAALMARLFWGTNLEGAAFASSQLLNGGEVTIKGVKLYLTPKDRADLAKLAKDGNFDTMDIAEAALQMGLENALRDASGANDRGITGRGTNKLLKALGLNNNLKEDNFAIGSLVAFGPSSNKHLGMVTKIENGQVHLVDGYGRKIVVPLEHMAELSQSSPDDRYGFNWAVQQTQSFIRQAR